MSIENKEQLSTYDKVILGIGVVSFAGLVGIFAKLYSLGFNPLTLHPKKFDIDANETSITFMSDKNVEDKLDDSELCVVLSTREVKDLSPEILINDCEQLKNSSAISSSLDLKGDTFADDIVLVDNGEYGVSAFNYWGHDNEIESFIIAPTSDIYSGVIGIAGIQYMVASNEDGIYMVDVDHHNEILFGGSQSLELDSKNCVVTVDGDYVVSYADLDDYREDVKANEATVIYDGNLYNADLNDIALNYASSTNDVTAVLQPLPDTKGNVK